jgi:hypothetical protein
MGRLGESGGSSVGNGGESDVENRDLHGCRPPMSRLKADRLAPMSKY